MSGFEQTLDQGPLSDQGMLKTECLNASKNKLLCSASTDTLMSKTKWQTAADTFSALPDTRFIRVQIIAFRNVGGDKDGYFDNVSLIVIPSLNYILIVIISTAVAIVIGLILYFRKRKSVSQESKTSSSS